MVGWGLGVEYWFVGGCFRIQISSLSNLSIRFRFECQECTIIDKCFLLDPFSFLIALIFRWCVVTKDEVVWRGVGEGKYNTEGTAERSHSTVEVQFIEETGAPWNVLKWEIMMMTVLDNQKNNRKRETAGRTTGGRTTGKNKKNKEGVDFGGRSCRGERGNDRNYLVK